MIINLIVSKLLFIGNVSAFLQFSGSNIGADIMMMGVKIYSPSG